MGDDLSVWQNALTHLECHTQQSHTQTAFSSQLLMQARLRIAQRAGYQYSRSVIRHNDMTDYLSRLNAQLHTALTLEDILQGISAHLDVLRIQTMHIALFEPGGEAGMDGYRLYSLCPDGYRCHADILRSEQLPALAPGITSSGYHLALVPLTVESRQVGFIIFDADNLPLCGSLTWQISAALRGSQLYQRAAQDRQAANRLKSRFLAMVSHELRMPLALITGLRRCCCEAAVIRRRLNNLFSAFMPQPIICTA